MNGWDDLEEWVEKEAEDLVKRAKTKAGEVFLTSVTSPTNFNKKLPAGGMGGNTPVRTGNLIANTEVGVNRAPDGTNSNLDEDGMETYFKNITKIKTAGVWDKVYFVNATPYNIQAEFKGWFKTQPYRYWEKSYNDMVEAINK